MPLKQGILTRHAITVGAILLALLVTPLPAGADEEDIYPVGRLKPRDSVAILKVGDKAPDIKLPGLYTTNVSLSTYRGRKNVVLSFVPAAWTPVCSDQWPGYHLARQLFEDNNAILLGITVDNLPSLHAWTRRMAVGERLWFEVLSDFFPHGRVAQRYGVLRSDGTSERALFVIDRDGIIRYIDIHDINRRPPLEHLIAALEAIHNQGLSEGE